MNLGKRSNSAHSSIFPHCYSRDDIRVVICISNSFSLGKESIIQQFCSIHRTKWWTPLSKSSNCFLLCSSTNKGLNYDLHSPTQSTLLHLLFSMNLCLTTLSLAISIPVPSTTMAGISSKGYALTLPPCSIFLPLFFSFIQFFFIQIFSSHEKILDQVSNM